MLCLKLVHAAPKWSMKDLAGLKIHPLLEQMDLELGTTDRGGELEISTHCWFWSFVGFANNDKHMEYHQPLILPITQIEIHFMYSSLTRIQNDAPRDCFHSCISWSSLNMSRPNYQVYTASLSSTAPAARCALQSGMWQSTQSVSSSSS